MRHIPKPRARARWAQRDQGVSRRVPRHIRICRPACPSRGRQIAANIASGLHYLHEMKHVIHFDLKSPNVLLDRHGTAKIADVGLSKILRDTTHNTISSGIGTMMWASPEQLMGTLPCP